MRRQVRGGLLAMSATACMVMLGTGVASAGSGWTIQSTYAPPIGKEDTALDEISCSASNACMAIGHAGPADFIYEIWNGTTWSPHLKAYPLNSGAVGGVSCTSASACTLMAGDQNKQLALRWNGTSWQTQTVPAAKSSGYGGVSCLKTPFCMAVGGGGINLNSTTRAAKWDGKAWSIVSTPPTGQPFAVLRNVSCVTPSDCVALGEDGNLKTQLVPLIEAWNGTTWTIQKTPSVPSGTLNSLSCATADSCSAIGTYMTGGVIRSLVEHWNGTSWARQTVPVPADVYLSSVSCPSATSCTAAGQRSAGSGAEVAAAAHWDGTTWALQNPPNPKGATRSQFNDLSCPTTTVCEAVGMIHVNAKGLRFRDRTVIEAN